MAIDSTKKKRVAWNKGLPRSQESKDKQKQTCLEKYGGRPYDPNDEECQKQLAIWQEKAKTSQFYKNAIETWTVRDVTKSTTSKHNNLNILFIYKLK